MQAGNEPFFRELQQEVNREFSLPSESFISYDQLLQILAGRIRSLIDKDFHQLVSLLYRIDVSEKKVKDLLAKKPEEDAASLIARLILERLSQKIKTRQQFSRQGDNFKDEERW